MTKHRYYSNCVSWPRNDVHEEGGLCDMIEQEQSITRRTFLAHVDPTERREIEAQLGYSLTRDGGLTMKRDYHVSYYRSRLHGKPVYFFKHSAIEYVFTQEAP